jgi:type IV pilus assembly protein PilX
MRHSTRYSARAAGTARQSGAALVVGLILLVIITLLAISGMGTAAVELVMAGNEQYRQRAFQASGSGIEQALTKLASVPQTSTPTVVTANAPSAVSGEKFTTSSLYLGDDLNIPGFSAGKFVGIHYQITSEGTSSRNSRSEQQQGAFVVQSAGGGAAFGSIQ